MFPKVCALNAYPSRFSTKNKNGTIVKEEGVASQYSLSLLGLHLHVCTLKALRSPVIKRHVLKSAFQ